MQIVVKELNGAKREYAVEATTTVLRVKEKLQASTGIAVEQIRLIFGGKQLQDDFQLKDYGIQGRATMHMVLQLKGGSR